MKKILLLAFVFLICYCFNTEAQLLKKIKENITKKSSSSSEQTNQKQSDVNDKFDSKDYGHVKYKLDEGEKLVVGEECVYFNGSFEQFQFITQRKDGKYYFHNHDRISGPFDKPPIDSLKDCYDKRPNFNKRETKDNAALAKYQTVNSNSTTPYGIKIGNKSYGPYNGIMSLYVSPNEANFYAIVVMITSNGNDNDMEYYLVSNKGKVKLPGLAANLLISPSGNVCAIPMTDLQMKGSAELQTDPHAPVTLIYDDGHKKGPIAEFWDHQYSLLTDGGAYVQFKHTSPSTLFVDGKPSLKFTKEILNFAVFLNDNATSGAQYENGSLYFTDGTAIENEAISPHLIKEGGKSIVRWIAFDKQGSIYECKKEL